MTFSTKDLENARQRVAVYIKAVALQYFSGYSLTRQIAMIDPATVEDEWYALADQAIGILDKKRSDAAKPPQGPRVN
jgi:hypothetical protein